MIRLDHGESPWPPLVPGGQGLNRPPEDPVALRSRLSQLLGVPADCITAAPGYVTALDAITREFGPARPVSLLGELEKPAAERALHDRPLIVIEDGIEFLDDPDVSLVALAATDARLFLIRTLTAYGISGRQMSVIVHAADLRAAVRVALNCEGLATPLQRLALAALDPSRMAAAQARIDLVRSERRRMLAALPGSRGCANVIKLADADPGAFDRYGIQVSWHEPRSRKPPVEITIGTPEENDLVLAAMGAPVPPRPPARSAEVARDTKETRIVCAVDLDRADPVRIDTGIGFYDHMLEQVARHGGFSLILSCAGDLHIEAHHTVEDCALALGDALRQALGDRAGVARFGFVAPLDEAEAAVTLDLSGRPLSKFTGSFARPLIGAYPTEMTPHVFRSLADGMRATIHVKVEGEDDHHKTEACFKSFGRALRMAIRREGDAIPSTKGVLA